MTDREQGFREHELKTDPAVFDAVAAHLKPYELRADDRGVGPIAAFWSGKVWANDLARRDDYKVSHWQPPPSHRPGAKGGEMNKQSIT